MERRVRWAGRWSRKRRRRGLARWLSAEEAPAVAVRAGRWIGAGLAIGAFALGVGLALRLELGGRR